jgi:hypothetical protein
LENMTDTLIARVDKTGTLTERVHKLIEAGKTPLEWGSPLLSTTPTSFAVRELAVQLAALENAVREIASELQKLSARD